MMMMVMMMMMTMMFVVVIVEQRPGPTECAVLIDTLSGTLKKRSEPTRSYFFSAMIQRTGKVNSSCAWRKEYTFKFDPI